jgi:L-aspartate oxidase
MNYPQLKRRYLVSFRLPRISHRFTDVLVIGSGVAGNTAALSAAEVPGTEVLLLSKSALQECSTQYAQGGIAAVLSPEETDDSLDSHARDTIEAACGLGDPGIIRLVVEEGVRRVEDLIAWGAQFDRKDGRIDFTREGGHSRPRILHTGDSTGQEIERTLLAQVVRRPEILALKDTYVIDLITRDGECQGALVYRPSGDLQAIWAKRTILATGGVGRLYRETTNPQVTTGDGLAIALRAGAVLRDPEFIQFHPTTLYVAGADRFLITEAVRGEGGRLIDKGGERFMHRFHPLAELAPRDTVSRGIISRMKELGDTKVFLDLSAIPPERILERFPQVREFCLGFGIDILKEPIPVRPSAHYTVGGIRIDAEARTDVPGLFAAGEVASSGLHGANRLGSNSLLEGLVFGTRAGARAALEAKAVPIPRVAFDPPAGDFWADDFKGQDHLDLADLRMSLQSEMWRRVGIERTGEDLRRALRQILEWVPYVLDAEFAHPTGWTLQNMMLAGYAIALGALRREESRGVHFRADFPQRDDPRWGRHQDIRLADMEEIR